MHIFIQIGHNFVHVFHNLVQLSWNMQTWYWSYLYFFSSQTDPSIFLQDFNIDG